MRQISLAVLFLLIISGCTHHYYVVSGSTMEMYLKKSKAEKVIFFSSIDGFEPHEAQKTLDNWVVTLPVDIRFRYFYVVDGEVFLPPCRMKENDDFGSENCLFEPNL